MPASASASSAAATHADLCVALHEWSVVCRFLTAGQGIAVVRKGGIHERGGGCFAPEHERFWLMPTSEHQRAERLRPDVAAAYADLLRPGEGQDTHAVPPPPHVLSAWASVAAVWKVTHRAVLPGLAAELAWSADELAARFAYRDQPFVFVLALRVFRLRAPAQIDDHASYAGCRSWIPLRADVPTSPCMPAIDDRAFAERLAALAKHLGAPNGQARAC